MTTVLFACVHNAGRSQMAAALFNLLADPARAHAISAGTRPAGAVHPAVVTVMQEVGIDLSNAQPRLLTDDLAHCASVLVTMGCGEECPVVPGALRLDWPFPDPTDRPIEEVRTIRNAIRSSVVALLTKHRWIPPGTRPD